MTMSVANNQELSVGEPNGSIVQLVKTFFSLSLWLINNIFWQGKVGIK